MIIGYNHLFNENQVSSFKTLVCIAMIDDRIIPKDFEVSRAQTVYELQELIKSRTREEMDYTQTNVIINKLYALRHGYKLFLSNMTEYTSFMEEYPKRNSVWLKPNFVLDIMEKQNECEWIAFMDSDAHFWMDHHQTSLDEFFSTASILEGSFPYEEIELQKVYNNGFYPWKLQSPYFLIGANGMYQHGIQIGWPFPMHTVEQDPSCAGVFFVKNTDNGKRMMREWIYGPDNASQEIKDMYEHFSQAWAREQSVLNRIIIPRHSNHVAYYSFMDFASTSGRTIRHIWSQWYEGRYALQIKDMESLFST
jgi:hypothetical protein